MWKGLEITCSEIRDFQIPDEVHGGYSLSSESLEILPRIRRGPKCQVNTISSFLIIFLQSSSTLSLLLLNRLRFTILVFFFLFVSCCWKCGVMIENYGIMAWRWICGDEEIGEVMEESDGIIIRRSKVVFLLTWRLLC